MFNSELSIGSLPHRVAPALLETTSYVSWIGTRERLRYYWRLLNKNRIDQGET